MGLSEAEAATRLERLRADRAAIDGEIADLLLYLDLARRLGGSSPSRPRVDAAPSSPDERSPTGSRPSGDPVRTPPEPSAPRDRPAEGQPARDPASGPPAGLGTLPPAVPFAQDPTAARRYGRALIDAACAAIAAAGRPLHAGEILPHLLAEGFSLPGHDPVAALNTRLWKRSGPGGPLVRLGDAVYALGGATEAADPAG